MGNKIGAMVSRIPAEDGIDTSSTSAKMAEDRLISVNKVLTERKQTPAAVLSYLMASVMGFMGRGVSSSSTMGLDDEEDEGPPSSFWLPFLFEKAHANASVVVTNVRGPEKLIHLDGRPVHRSLGFLPLPPGIPIGVVVSSYNQQVSLTVTAEPWAVPNADQFLDWVAEEYASLRSQAFGIEAVSNL